MDSAAEIGVASRVSTAMAFSSVHLPRPPPPLQRGLRPAPLASISLLLLASACDDTTAGAPSTQRDAAVASVAAERDSGGADAAPDVSSPWQPPTLNLPEQDAARPYYLSETGLYVDLEAKTLAPDLIEFTPAFTLWTDGAVKRRWLRLPPGTQIDSRDMDHWEFPIGTVTFKEFSREGKRLETRMVVRTGPDRFDYWMGAFVWNDDESDAVFAPDGAADLKGTNHDVPNTTQCGTCHHGDRGRVLGFSAVQLAATRHSPLLEPVTSGGAPDVLRDLIDADLLSAPPELSQRFDVPGDPPTRAALGYLHANCGHCHNAGGTARPDTDMDLRLDVAASAPGETAAYRTTLGQLLQNFDDTALTLRVSPGDAAQSALTYRMRERGTLTQMPSLGTELVDEAGLAAVERWIDSLAPDAGP